MLRRTQTWLTEPVMGFLALVAAFLALAPVMLELGPRAAAVLDVLDWPIVAVFAVEFVGRLAAAPSRTVFWRNPWNWLDLVIVAAPFGSLVPGAGEALQSSPALRLLRIGRVIVLGARRGGRLAPRPTLALAGDVPTEIHGVVSSDSGVLRSMDWSEFVERLRDPQEEWFHVTCHGSRDLPRLASELGVPEAILSNKLLLGAHPRIEVLDGKPILFVSYLDQGAPGGKGTDEPRRVNVLLVGMERNIVSVSLGTTSLAGDLGAAVASAPAEAPFLVRTMIGLLQVFLRRHARALGALEDQVRELEYDAPEQSGPEFFNKAFRRRRDLGALRADLRCIPDILSAICEHWTVLSGGKEAQTVQLTKVRREAEDLQKDAEELSEGLVGMIELHLNIASFEMNKVMRLLALVTTVALIPSVVGGLLGMNVHGNPWPATLSQVAFGVGAVTVLCIYTFAVKGWLR